MTRTARLQEVACLLCGSGDSGPFLESRVQLAPATGEIFPFRCCRECGLVFLSPRPMAEEMGFYYPPDYLPHRGPGAWGRWESLVRGAERKTDRARVREVLRSHLLPPGTPVLDVGCGRPTFLREMAGRGAASVGVDVSAEGWASDPANWAGIRLVEGTLPEAEAEVRAFAPGGFEVLTLWHMLEHAPDPVGLLESLRRLAAPGAVLVVEVPNLDSWTARHHGSDWAGLHTPRHTAAYTPRTLTRMLERAGWQVERQLGHGTLDPWVLWWLGRQIRRGRSLEENLERAFPAFVAGKVAALPLTLLARWIPLGVQLAVARNHQRAGVPRASTWTKGPRTAFER